MQNNAFKVPTPRLDDSYRDPRREKELKDFDLMPKGKSSIANLDPMGFYKEVKYENDKTNGAN